MPRNDDKPFLMIRKGRFSAHIAPRNAAGWRQFGAWMVLLTVMTAGFVAYVASKGEGPEMWWATGVYLLGTGAWSLAMIRWMRARAEIIDIDDVLRDRQKPRRNPRK